MTIRFDSASSPARGVELWKKLSGDRFPMVWVALIGLLLLCVFLQPGTLGAAALFSMLPFAAVLMIASIGQLLTIQSGGMDMSVPGSMTLAAAVVTGVAGREDDLLGLAVMLALVAVLIGGLLNGMAITLLRIPPIVATLAVNALLIGVVQSYTGGVLQAVPPSLFRIASGRTFGVPHTLIVAVLFVGITAFVMMKTTWGRRLVAVGAQPASARAAGIGVSRYLIGTYAAAGLCFGVAGILLAGYLETPATSIASPYLFSTITAVVIGGTALGGGRGRIIGTAVGALFLSQLNVFLTATGAPPSMTYLVQAAAIAVAVLLNSPAAVSKLTSRLLKGNRRFPGAVKLEGTSAQ